MWNRSFWRFNLSRWSYRTAGSIHTSCKFLVLLVLISAACSQPPPGRGAGEVVASSNTPVKFKVETVFSNLEVPWSIVWAPDGRMFFTERPGRIRVFENGQLRPAPVLTVS